MPARPSRRRAPRPPATCSGSSTSWKGALAALVREDAPLYAFANSLVVFGTRGVLVVDTQQSPVAARTLLDWIRGRTRLPVRWVVTTHGHSDHTYGNQVYRKALPDVGIVAHETVRRLRRPAGLGAGPRTHRGLPAAPDCRLAP